MRMRPACRRCPAAAAYKEMAGCSFYGLFLFPLPRLGMRQSFTPLVHAAGQIHVVFLLSWISKGASVMDIQRRRLLQLLAGAAATSAPSRFALADDYPSRPITLIVGFAAGGPTDVYARILAEPLQSSLGVPVIVEDVVGAAGTIATARVASAAPDGYTLDIGPGMSTHVINGAIYSLAYDVVTDFTPIALLSFLQQVILAKKAIPADDLKGLIAWLKANPGLAMQATSGERQRRAMAPEPIASRPAS